MQASRLSREKFASTPSGNGAALKEARWSSIGVKIIYTAMNRPLAIQTFIAGTSVKTTFE